MIYIGESFRTRGGIGMTAGTNFQIGKFLVKHLLYPDDKPDLIDGVELRKLSPHFDDRGSLIELVKEFSTDTMVYMSRTNLGVARDEDRWHLHYLQTDRFTYITGSCIFALSDGKVTHRIYLTSEDNVQLIIPPNVYHCFLACSQGFTLINVPTKIYNPLDELRIKFEAVEAEAPWIIQST